MEKDHHKVIITATHTVKIVLFFARMGNPSLIKMNFFQDKITIHHHRFLYAYLVPYLPTDGEKEQISIKEYKIVTAVCIVVVW